MKYTNLLIILIICSCKQSPSNGHLISPPVLVEFGVVTLALSDSTKEYGVLKNKEAYEILSTLISEDSVTEDSSKIKLITLTTESFRKESLSKNNVKLLDSLEITVADSNVIFKWDCNKLKNVYCISFQDAIQIFRNRSSELSWDLFHRKYGSGGLHAYSLPLMNKSGDMAVVFHIWNGEHKSISTNLFVLKKQNNKWTVEKKN